MRNYNQVKNETHIQIEELIDDLMHFRNLPSISTIFVALATVVNNVLDLFVSRNPLSKVQALA